ncbi:MAG: AF1514 family protein [Pseudomonadota bacterium]
MTRIDIDYTGSHLNYRLASTMARDIACGTQMSDPTIVAWHQRSTHAMSHRFDGAREETWWEKYGLGNGGVLEVSVGNEFEFVMMDSRDYETLKGSPLRNLKGSDGMEYVCMTPLLGNSRTANAKACVPLDDWMADQY